MLLVGVLRGHPTSHNILITYVQGKIYTYVYAPPDLYDLAYVAGRVGAVSILRDLGSVSWGWICTSADIAYLNGRSRSR